MIHLFFRRRKRRFPAIHSNGIFFSLFFLLILLSLKGCGNKKTTHPSGPFELLKRKYQNFKTDLEFNKEARIYKKAVKTLYQHGLYKMDPKETTQIALNAILKRQDPYGQYMNKEQKKAYSQKVSGHSTGLGVRLEARQVKENVFITRISMLHPEAKAAGLEIFDQLIKINGVDVEKKDLLTIHKLLAKEKEKNKPIELIVKRQNKLITIPDIKPKKLHNPTVPYYRMFKGGIAYIKIQSFNGNVSGEVKAAIQKLSNKGKPKKFILDLRGNLGGSMIEIHRTLNLFIPYAKIYKIVGRRSSYQVSTDRLHGHPYAGSSIVLLVDNYSASASETMAEVIQDGGYGVVVSCYPNTYGKGVAQISIPLSGGMLKYTYSVIKSQGGRSANQRKASGQKIRTKTGREITLPEKGLAPDLLTKKKILPGSLMGLIQDGIFNEFAAYYVQQQTSLPPLGKFKVTKEIYEMFKKWVPSKEFKVPSDNIIKQLKEAIKPYRKSHQEYEKLYNKVQELEKDVQQLKIEDLDTFQPIISYFLEIALNRHVYLRKGEIEASLKTKHQSDLKEAIKILNKQEIYNHILHH